MKLGRERGLSSKQLNAFKKARQIYDEMFEIAGIADPRYINLYYTRYQPYMKEHGTATT